MQASSNYLKVSAIIVGIVLLVSILSRSFGNSRNVTYTSWFGKRLNSLVDVAEGTANRAEQDRDPVIALQDYCTSLGIMDTLRTLVSDEELSGICNLNIHRFMEMLTTRRESLVSSMK